MFYQLDWLDSVIDIREQFPLNRERILDVAASTGIRYPADPRSRTPTVMTTDFLVDAIVDGRQQCFAYAVKPATDLSKPRVAEKMDIERSYWQAESVVWGTVTGDQLNRQLISNIRSTWWQESSSNLAGPCYS